MPLQAPIAFQCLSWVAVINFHFVQTVWYAGLFLQGSQAMRRACNCSAALTILRFRCRCSRLFAHVAHNVRTVFPNATSLLIDLVSSRNCLAPSVVGKLTWAIDDKRCGEHTRTSSNEADDDADGDEDGGKGSWPGDDEAPPSFMKHRAVADFAKNAHLMRTITSAGVSLAKPSTTICMTPPFVSS